MIRAEWTVRLTSGPVVGSADVADVAAAWAAVRAALRDALPSWGPEHAAAMARLEGEARSVLATEGRWEHRSAGVAIVLTRAAAGG